MTTTAPQLLDVGDLRQAFDVAEQWLARNRDAINAINVYPVPDGDTGTNMLLTLRTALEAADHAEAATAGPYMQAMAHGALLGARGNSGVILSQMIRGLASALDGVETIDCASLCRAFELAADTAYEAMSEPVEGTMLTVMRDAARAAVEAGSEDSSFEHVLPATQLAAERSVERTPELLPRLREAGVVDAGGLGVAVLLTGLRTGILGEPLPEAPEPPAGSVELAAVEHEGHGYCTEYLIEGDALDRDALVRALEAAGGDSILVVGDPTALHVHVHVADPGPAFSVGVAVGSLHHIKVDNMQAQHEQWAAGHEAAAGASTEALPALGLVAVASGRGIAAAFRDLGAVTLSPEAGKPSAGAFLEAARRSGEQHVFLLPNDKDAILAAKQAATEAPGFITVIPARTIAAGLSAAIAYLPEGTPGQIAAAMRAAMEGVRCVEVTRAARNAHVDGVEVAAGDAIALLDGMLVALGDTLEDALLAGLSKAVSESSELVTVYLGAEAPRDAAGHVLTLIEQAHPDVSVEVIEGGQPHYPYVASVE